MTQLSFGLNCRLAWFAATQHTTMKTHSTIKPLACLALMGITLSSLVACGGGGGSDAPVASVAAPTTVTVSAPQSPPSTGNTSAGISQSGSLQYLVYDNTSPTTGTGTTATAAVDATAKTITFPSAAPFATGLVIGGITTESVTLNGATGVGGTSYSGNVFYFCSTGSSTKAVDEPAAMAGEKVAFSGNVTPLTNVAILYGKKYNEQNCTNAPNTWTFGDGNGNLTLSLKQHNGSAGPTMTAAEVTTAFSAAGVTLTTGMAAGANVKLRGYASVEGGVTKYLVAALLNEGGTLHTVLLYLP